MDFELMRLGDTEELIEHLNRVNEQILARQEVTPLSLKLLEVRALTTIAARLDRISGILNRMYEE